MPDNEDAGVYDSQDDAEEEEGPGAEPEVVETSPSEVDDCDGAAMDAARQGDVVGLWELHLVLNGYKLWRRIGDKGNVMRRETGG